MLQVDRHVIARNSIARALRPLDQHERVFGHDLVPTEVRQLVRALEAIEVEMKDAATSAPRSGARARTSDW